MKKIAIVTDSNAGILPSEVEGRDIFVLPMPFLIDGEEYFEGINLSQSEFYEKLEGNANVSTSQPSSASVIELWDRILKEYDQIIYIPMSSSLSASCENAIRLSEEYKDKVFVVDNQKISVIQKSCVFDAEKMALEGKSANEIVEYLKSTKFDSTIYIMVPNLKYLKKGGRLTPAAAMIGSLLNIKPVLQIQGGKLDSFAKAMSIKQALKTMIKAMKQDIEKRFQNFVEKDKFEIYVAYTKTEEDAKQFQEQIESELGMKVTFVDPLSLSVACHIGPGALAIAGARRY